VLREMVLCVLVALLPAVAWAQVVWHGVGDLAGGPVSSAVRDATRSGGVIYAVGGSAANSQVLCIGTNNPPGCVPAYRPDTPILWTWNGSTATLTPLPNLVVNTTATNAILASAITPDAAYIASRARSVASGSTYQAVRVTTSGLANLNLNASPFPVASGSSFAAAISTDGSILYGMGNNVSQALRFDVNASTTTAIPFLSVSHTGSAPAGKGTSSNGSVMIGVSFVAPFSGSNGQAFRYVQGSGVTAIPLPAGGTWSNALGVSPDGNLALVCGNSTDFPKGEIYIYNATSATSTSLGSPNTPWNLPGVAGITSDGSVVAAAFSGSGGTTDSYFHNSRGWFHFTSALLAGGVDVSALGWQHLQVNGISSDGTLAFGQATHNGSQDGFVAEFPAGYLAGFAAAPVAPGNTRIVGAWSFADAGTPGDPVILVLGADGTYYFIQASVAPAETSAAPGFERGRYTWDAGTHAFTVTTVQDTNGDAGLDGANGQSGVTFTVSGDACVIDLGAESYSGTRVTGGPGSAVGGWIIGNPAVADSSGVLVLLGDGTYYHAQDGVPDGGGHDGIEKGTYSWNPATGAFAATSIAVDTNGDWGLSNPSGPITLALSSDGLTATTDDGAGPVALTRVVDPLTFGRKSDILWRHSSLGEVWLWPMDGAARVSETYVRTVPDTDWEIRGRGDQNGDGQPDILWRNKTSGQVYLWPMDGTTVLSETYVATVDPAYDIVGTRDYNGDGKSDILWRHLTNGEVWIWLMDGATPLSQVYVDTVDPAYAVVGSGDLDGDTKADIVWRHSTYGEVWVWLMNGTSRTSQTHVGTVPDVGYEIVGVADHSGDGKADILWHHATRGEVWIWPMNGTTVVSQSYVDTVPDAGYQIVGSGDYNGDTKADILWHHATRGEVWVWLMDGTTKVSETWVATVPEVGYQIVKVK